MRKSKFPELRGLLPPVIEPPLVFLVVDKCCRIVARFNYPRHAALIAADLGDGASVRYAPSNAPDAILWDKGAPLPTATKRETVAQVLAGIIVDGVYEHHARFEKTGTD